jgi:hypothetical protein
VQDDPNEAVEAQQKNEMLGSNQEGFQQGGVAAYMHPSTPPRIATPPLPTEHTYMRADELSNGNFSHADARAYNIDNRELKNNLGHPPPVLSQIHKEEDVADVDLFDEIPDDMLPENPPSASRETLVHRSSRPPKTPISKPTGFEDYALSPSSAAKIELLHRFDLDTLISSLPSVASPPMMSPEVQRRAEHTVNSSSISQLVPTTLMPDLEQIPVYGAPVSRLGPDHDMRCTRATSPQKPTQQTPSMDQRSFSPTPDVHISHNPSAPAATDPYLAISASPGSLSPNPHSTTIAQPPPSPPISQGGSAHGYVTQGKNSVTSNYTSCVHLGVSSVRTNPCVGSGTQRYQSFLTKFLIFLGKNFCPKTYNCNARRVYTSTSWQSRYLIAQQDILCWNQKMSTGLEGKPHEGQYSASTDQELVAAWICDVTGETVSQVGSAVVMSLLAGLVGGWVGGWVDALVVMYISTCVST